MCGSTAHLAKGGLRRSPPVGYPGYHDAVHGPTRRAFDRSRIMPTWSRWNTRRAWRLRSPPAPNHDERPPFDRAQGSVPAPLRTPWNWRRRFDGLMPSRYYFASMVDTRSPEQRRRIMQSVGTKDTGPEWAVRRALHRHGFRYRLHVKVLPGRPDIVLPKRKAVIFVHGCFWHGHDCSKGSPPKSKLDYWGPKLAANRSRDSARTSELQELGWRVLTVWQCETRDENALAAKLLEFLAAR